MLPDKGIYIAMDARGTVGVHCGRCGQAVQLSLTRKIKIRVIVTKRTPHFTWDGDYVGDQVKRFPVLQSAIGCVQCADQYDHAVLHNTEPLRRL